MAQDAAGGDGQGARASATRVVRPEFTGSAAEYFRIWIVNLFFSLVTLGVYSAWAKVRKKRYFYGSTRFDGASFDYFASPKAILYGRIVAVAVFAAYALVAELFPASRFAFWALALVALPALIVRSLLFNARNTGYRGLRFNFGASAFDALRRLVKAVAVTALTFGLALPYLIARFKSFVVSNHAFGESRFTCELPARALFGIYIRGMLILFAMTVPSGVLGFVLFRFELPEGLEWLTIAGPMVVMYVAYAVAFAYTTARTTNLQWDSTRGPGMRFSSTLSAVALARLYVGNLFAAAASLGLLIPWAVVRTLRYRFENFSMVVEDEVVHTAHPQLARVGATGQEVGEIFHLELGV